MKKYLPVCEQSFRVKSGCDLSVSTTIPFCGMVIIPIYTIYNKKKSSSLKNQARKLFFFLLWSSWQAKYDEIVCSQLFWLRAAYEENVYLSASKLFRVKSVCSHFVSKPSISVVFRVFLTNVTSKLSLFKLFITKNT